MMLPLPYVRHFQFHHLRYLFCDSGRSGTQQSFLNIFKGVDGSPYAKSMFHINYSEDSVKEHRKVPCLALSLTSLHFKVIVTMRIDQLALSLTSLHLLFDCSFEFDTKGMSIMSMAGGSSLRSLTFSLAAPCFESVSFIECSILFRLGRSLEGRWTEGSLAVKSDCF